MFGVAFMMGLVGSLHCVGMCGPLALVANRLNAGTGAASALAYNASRITIYVALGLIFGLLGYVAALNGLQKWLSVGMGIIIISVAIVQIAAPRFNSLLTNQFTFIFKLAAQLQRKGNGITSSATLGMINGFLPCGLVYMAVAGAIVQVTLTDAALFMMLFGLGTLPVMFTISMTGSRIPALLKSYYKPVLSFGLFAFGFFLLYRGLGMEFTTAINNMLNPGDSVVTCE